MQYKLLPLSEVKSRIGFVYNEGPPHDRNWDWVDSRYVEDLHPDTLNEFKEDAEIRVLIDESGKLMEFKGRLIIDSYFLLSKKSQAK